MQSKRPSEYTESVEVFFANDCIVKPAQILDAYMNGDLSDKSCMLLERHLLQCRRCENTWDALTLKMTDAMQSEAGPTDCSPLSVPEGSPLLIRTADPEYLAGSGNLDRLRNDPSARFDADDSGFRSLYFEDCPVVRKRCQEELFDVLKGIR